MNPLSLTHTQTRVRPFRLSWPHVVITKVTNILCAYMLDHLSLGKPHLRTIFLYRFLMISIQYFLQYRMVFTYYISMYFWCVLLTFNSNIDTAINQSILSPRPSTYLNGKVALTDARLAIQLNGDYAIVKLYCLKHIATQLQWYDFQT